MSARKEGYPRTINGVPTRLYRIWNNMKNRCYNPNNLRYKDYGGRGITVCPEWLGDFARFAEDVGEPADPRFSLDRIDNDGNYEPGNVRWADSITQASNSRRAVLVTINKETNTISGWCRKTGIRRCVYRQRIQLGWDIARALTEPANIKEGRTVTHLGKTLTLKEWAKETGLEYKTIVARDRKGEKPPHIFRPSQIKLIEFEGRSMTITDWGRLLGKNISTLRERLNNGQPLVKEDERQLL